MTRLVLLLACIAAPLSAEVRPAPAPGGDPRIQFVHYDPAQVVELQVTPGYELTVEFAPGERVETVAVGDANAWQVIPSKRADHLFIKPRQPGITTNMTVVTDARSYSFVLMPAYGPTPDMAFTVRFDFPMPAVATVEDVPAADAIRYRFSGAKALRPQAMRDDGVHTYIDWAEGQPLPAVFALDEAGKETLINGMVRDGHYVVDSVATRFVFRVDKQAAFATREQARRHD